MNTVIDYEDIKINLHLTSILFGGAVRGSYIDSVCKLKIKQIKKCSFNN